MTPWVLTIFIISGAFSDGVRTNIVYPDKTSCYEALSKIKLGEQQRGFAVCHPAESKP